MHCARRPFAAGYRALREIAFSGCGKALMPSRSDGSGKKISLNGLNNKWREYEYEYTDVGDLCNLYPGNGADWLYCLPFDQKL
jgi:hypothetical protein